MSKKPPTLSDVAKQAGVSRAAVSAVVNQATGNIRVSAETQQRVQDVAKRLGYIPNPLARGLRQRSSKAIGFVPMKQKTWGTSMETPVQYLLGTHIAQAAVPQGFHVVEASAETAESREGGALLDFMRSRMVDGVILHGPESNEEVQRFLDAGIPVVQLMRLAENVNTFSVVVDPEPGISAAVNHLVDLGHQSIAFIGTSHIHPNDAVRLEVFRKTLARYELDPSLCPIIDVSRYHLDVGKEATIDLLQRESPPTALITGGDSLGLGALHAAYHLNVRVPDELSIISFDDTFAGSLYPRVTSISQPYRKIADQSIKWIKEASGNSMKSTNTTIQSVVYPSSLVVRDSTTRRVQGGDS